MLRIMNKLKKISYYEEKKRFLIVILVMFLLLVLAIKLFQIAYAAYQSSAKLNANIEKAFYILEEGNLDFNIDLEKIQPSQEPYTYKFSISNFNEKKHSDVDIEYQINMITTTNLPLKYELYRNENYSDESANNLFASETIKQDSDGAWYNYFEGQEKYKLSYNEDITDIYTLVIYFPENYKNSLNYADNLENIEIQIISKQVTE